LAFNSEVWKGEAAVSFTPEQLSTISHLLDEALELEPGQWEG